MCIRGYREVASAKSKRPMHVSLVRTRLFISHHVYENIPDGNIHCDGENESESTPSLKLLFQDVEIISRTSGDVSFRTVFFFRV